MPRTLKYLIVILLISNLFGSGAFACQSSDTDDITIHIEVRPVFISLPPYWVDIYKTNNIIKVVYSIEVLENYRPLRTDKDSILLDRKIITSYDSVLTRIKNASVVDLENLEANKNRLLADGVYFTFTIVSKSGSKKVYAHSPAASSHPLLYELLTKTFDVYRNTKNSASWSKGKTYGY